VVKVAVSTAAVVEVDGIKLTLSDETRNYRREKAG
jgi:hypothetical protein